jgi:hypothetical protein
VHWIINQSEVAMSKKVGAGNPVCHFYQRLRAHQSRPVFVGGKNNFEFCSWTPLMRVQFAGKSDQTFSTWVISKKEGPATMSRQSDALYFSRGTLLSVVRLIIIYWRIIFQLILLDFHLLTWRFFTRKLKLYRCFRRMKNWKSLFTASEHHWYCISLGGNWILPEA